MTSAGADADAWCAVVELDALARWMDGQGLGEGPLDAVAPLGGGTQNIMLRFTRAGRDYVFRRPPRHPRPESDEVMRREMRVLAALAGGPVPHPALVTGCGDPGPMGAAFYLMAPVDGFNATLGLPSPHADAPQWRRRMGEALVDGAAALSSVDIDAAGLAGFGRLEGWLGRQVPRWRRQLEGYAEFQGWGGEASLVGLDAVCAWLAAHVPDTFRPGLVHGDYHIGNVLYSRDSPELAAVVDWELASLGDPLLDLGGLIATWPDGEAAPILSVEPWAGFPGPDEVLDRYLAATGRGSAEARWFAVLARLRLAVLLEGTHARACAGLAPRATGERLHDAACALLRAALRNLKP